MISLNAPLVQFNAKENASRGTRMLEQPKTAAAKNERRSIFVCMVTSLDKRVPRLDIYVIYIRNNIKYYVIG